MRAGIKVRLTVDLTRYHPALKRHAEGVTTDGATPNPAQIAVAFPEAGICNIFAHSLEVMDAEVLRQAQQRQDDEDALIVRTLKRAIVKFSRNKELRSVWLEYEGNCVSHAPGRLAKRYLDLLDKHGLPYEIERG